jgi:hypothetical protein
MGHTDKHINQQDCYNYLEIIWHDWFEDWVVTNRSRFGNEQCPGTNHLVLNPGVAERIDWPVKYC